MELLCKIPQSDLAAWRSLYLKLGTPEFQDLLAYLTKTSLLEPAMTIKEWLDEKDIIDIDGSILRKRVENQFQGKKIIPSGQPMKLGEIYVMTVLQDLHRNKMPTSRLAALIAADLNKQLYNYGIFSLSIVNDEDIQFTSNPVASLKPLDLTFPEGKIWIFPAMSIDMEKIGRRLKGYRYLAKIEYCYFRHIIESFHKQYLIDNYPLSLEDKPVTLYGLLNSPNEDIKEWQKSFTSAIIAIFTDISSESLGPAVYSRFLLESEGDFVKDLISRTVTEDGINEKFLRANVKLRYPHL